MQKKIIQLLHGLTVYILATMSCTNPFDTRDVEQPDNNKNSDIFDQPISSEVVIRNLRYALVQKNLSNYMNSFIDTNSVKSVKFKFIPEPSIETERFLNWTLEDEKNYLQRVFTNSADIEVSQFDQDIIFTQISTAIDSVQTSPFFYQLKITFSDSIMTYTGKARMKLMRDINSLWAIYYWEDLRDEDSNQQTWSVLKSIYRFN